METDAPTCVPKIFKLCIVKIVQGERMVKSIAMQTAYLQGDEIERILHMKPPEEAKTKKLWKLKKTVYGLKDAAWVWYKSVVGHIQELEVELEVVWIPQFFSGKMEKN